MVNDVIDSERLAVGEAAIAIVDDIPPMLTLRADPEQLFRVILNLVRNARQAIVAGGRAGRDHGRRPRGRRELVDRGHRHRARACRTRRTNICSPPFQGGARKGGSGLGLAISAELVRGHGGTLTLERTGPGGTAFDIRLPRGDGTI